MAQITLFKDILPEEQERMRSLLSGKGNVFSE